jgi:hypothetical protein
MDVRLGTEVPGVDGDGVTHRREKPLFADNAMRLIGELGDAGATGSVRPPCPRCGRVIIRSGYGGVTVVQW